MFRILNPISCNVGCGSLKFIICNFWILQLASLNFGMRHGKLANNKFQSPATCIAEFGNRDLGFGTLLFITFTLLFCNVFFEEIQWNFITCIQFQGKNWSERVCDLSSLPVWWSPHVESQILFRWRIDNVLIENCELFVL